MGGLIFLTMFQRIFIGYFFLIVLLRHYVDSRRPDVAWEPRGHVEIEEHIAILKSCALARTHAARRGKSGSLGVRQLSQRLDRFSQECCDERSVDRVPGLAPLEPLQAPGQAAETERSGDRRRKSEAGMAMSCPDAVQVALDTGEVQSRDIRSRGRTRVSRQARVGRGLSSPERRPRSESLAGNATQSRMWTKRLPSTAKNSLRWSLL